MVSLVRINQETNVSPYVLFFATLRSPHTRTAYKKDLIQFLRFLKQYCRGVTPELAEENHLTSFINNLKRNKASDRTINRKIAFLKKGL
jgi:site-specific recombinase XerD